MLLAFKDMTKEDMYRMVHSVYSEASYEIAKDKHPDMQDLSEAIREEEQYFVEKFLRKFMSKNENTYYVWDTNGEWVSAFRLTKLEGYYFMEALETTPEHRRKGYASELIKAVIQKLEEDESVVIRSNVRKTNTASLAMHRKCGFVIEGETGAENCFYGMLYQKGQQDGKSIISKEI